MSIPYVPQGTSRRFRVPRTLAADFTAFLNQDIPNTNMDFELVQNWYVRAEEGYESQYIRAEMYPDSTKSRYENTDNNMNIRADINSGIKKGDMIIQPNGEIFILDWFVALQSNNAPSRALRCNMQLEVLRFSQHEEEFDEDGYRIHNHPAAPYEIIAPKIPCNAYRYDGRPEYVIVSGTPGATDNALTLMTVQYNEKTKNIRIDDVFNWGDVTYRIVDVNLVGVDLEDNFGTLKLQAKKAEGGLHGY